MRYEIPFTFHGKTNHITVDYAAMADPSDAAFDILPLPFDPGACRGYPMLHAHFGPLSLAGMMDGYLYETADADAGEFRFFYMMPDTPATTYHLEFRYGSDVDALAQYNEGPYAYWLAAGFPADADAAMIESVITLFCEENLAEAAEEAPAA